MGGKSIHKTEVIYSWEVGKIIELNGRLSLATFDCPWVNITKTYQEMVIPVFRFHLVAPIWCASKLRIPQNANFKMAKRETDDFNISLISHQPFWFQTNIHIIPHQSTGFPSQYHIMAGWWLGPTPLKNMSSSIGMMNFPRLMGK